MAKQYKREQVITNPFTEVNSGLNETAKLLAAVQNNVDALNASLKNVSTQAGAIKSAMGGDVKGNSLDEINKINKAHAESIKLLKEEKALKTQLGQSEQQLQNLYEKFEAERAKNEAKRQADHAKREVQYNKEIAAQEKLNNVYSKAQIKLNTLTNEYRNLALRKELGAKLTDKESQRYEFLRQKIDRYDKALKATDASMGKHQRNVGNYASAWNGLGNSVQQLSRELPAFGNSMQTGFMAISNNLPIFFDEIKKVKNENKALAATGQPTVSAFKQIGQSIFSVTGLLGLGVTALTIFGSKIIEFITNNDDAEKAIKRKQAAQKAANEEVKKATDFVGKESAGYVNLIFQLKATNAGSSERARLISKINKEYHVTLKNIKDEAKFQEMLNQEVLDYIEYQRLRYKQEQNEDLLKRRLSMQEKDAKQLRELKREEKDLTEAIKLRELIEIGAGDVIRDNIITERDRRAGALATGKTMEALTMTLDNNRKKQEELTVANYWHNERLKELGFTSLETDKKIQGSKYTYEEQTGAVDKLTVSLAALDLELSKQIDRDNEIIEIRQRMLEMEQDFQAAKFADLREQEQKDQLERVAAGLEYESELVEFYREKEFDIRKKSLEERAKYEEDKLKDSLSDQYLIAVEAQNKERDLALLEIEQSKASEAEKQKARVRIVEQYLQNIEVINDNLSEDQKVAAVEYLAIQKKLFIDLVGLNKEKNDQIEQDNKETTEATYQSEIKEAENYYKKEKIVRLKSKASDKELAKQDLIDKKAELEEKIFIEEKYGRDATDLRLQLAELERQEDKKALEEKKKYYQELFKLGKKVLDDLFDEDIKDSQRKQKQIDDQINASQQSYDLLKEQAAQGNLAAEASLKEQQKITDKYRDQKQAEEERQAALEQAKKYAEMAINITNNLIQNGENPILAAGKGVGIVQVIKALFGKGFFFGTDDTGKNSPVSDEFGAITGFTHENEQVWSKKDRNDVDYATRQELKDAWKLVNSPQMILGKVPSKQDVAHSPITRELIGEVKSMNKKLDNMPNEFFSTEVIDGVLAAAHNRIIGNTHYKRFNTNA